MGGRMIIVIIVGFLEHRETKQTLEHIYKGFHHYNDVASAFSSAKHSLFSLGKRTRIYLTGFMIYSDALATPSERLEIGKTTPDLTLPRISVRMTAIEL